MGMLYSRFVRHLKSPVIDKYCLSGSYICSVPLTLQCHWMLETYKALRKKKMVLFKIWHNAVLSLGIILYLQELLGMFCYKKYENLNLCVPVCVCTGNGMASWLPQDQQLLQLSILRCISTSLVLKCASYNQWNTIGEKLYILDVILLPITWIE